MRTAPSQIADGRVDARALPTWIVSPKFKKADEKSMYFVHQPVSHGKAPDDLWQGFLELADARREIVERFANKHGGLCLCEAHGLPVGHSATCNRQRNTIYDEVEVSGHSFRRTHIHVESFTQWRNFARGLASLLRISTKIGDGKPGDEADWDAAHAVFTEPHLTGGGQPSAAEFVLEMERLWPKSYVRERPEMAMQRAIIKFQTTVTRVIAIAGVRPSFWRVPETGGFGIYLSAPPENGTLFGAVVLQLLPRLANPKVSEPIANCSVCGRLYFPTIAPRPDRRNYCEEHKNAKHRISKADRKKTGAPPRWSRPDLRKESPTVKKAPVRSRKPAEGL